GGGRGRGGGYVALDVDAPASQLGRESGVLALLADGQRQLTLGHDHLGGAGRLVDRDVAHLGRAQRIGDVLSGVLVPFDDVDLFAVQLVDDVLDAHAAHADARPDRIDAFLASCHRAFGSGAGLASAALEFD